MIALLIAQFLSALADNAILIVAIALLKTQSQTELIPALQAAFLAPFILLAPFVGQVADSFPKGRVMLGGNGLKLAGTLLMAWGISPLLAYLLVGIGAALYSPAKYGILSQIYEPERLVRANGLLEGSTIVAILLGVLLGGWLADHPPALAFGGLIATYALAGFANLLIPRLLAEHPGASFAPGTLVSEFFSFLRRLIADPDTRFSLLGTSLFWGSGTVLRLLLFVWVPASLAILDNQTPANLMGVVSVGIVFGAAAAGAWVSLATVNRALVGALLLGPAVLAMTSVNSLGGAALAMALIGFGGGLFVVPLNALLQERGHESIGAGNALAVQNFFENLSMVLFVGVYSLASSADLGIFRILAGFGLLLLVIAVGLTLQRVGLRAAAH